MTTVPQPLEHTERRVLPRLLALGILQLALALPATPGLADPSADSTGPPAPEAASRSELLGEPHAGRLRAAEWAARRAELRSSAERVLEHTERRNPKVARKRGERRQRLRTAADGKSLATEKPVPAAPAPTSPGLAHNRGDRGGSR